MNKFEWQRVGFRPGFLIPGLDPWVLPYYPNPAHLINGSFFLAPNPTCQVFAGPVQLLLGLFRGSPIQPNLIFLKETQTQTQINQHCYQLNPQTPFIIYERNKTPIFIFMYRFLHQHNIHSNFYILNPQTNTQNQKLLREEQNSIYHLWTDFYILNPQTNTQKQKNY